LLYSPALDEPLVIKLRVPGRLHYRDVAIRTVASVCHLVGSNQLPDRGDPLVVDPKGPDPQEVDALDLSDEFAALVVSAFSEVFNDIVLHGYAATEGAINIELEPGTDELVIRITDHGACFDQSKVKPPDLDSLPESGLGIFIVRSCVDEFTYEPGPPNVWTLKKRRTTGTTPPPANK
jgi:serine/threonine-protein kinase RsbW